MADHRRRVPQRFLDAGLLRAPHRRRSVVRKIERGGQLDDLDEGHLERDGDPHVLDVTRREQRTQLTREIRRLPPTARVADADADVVAAAARASGSAARHSKPEPAGILRAATPLDVQGPVIVHGPCEAIDLVLELRVDNVSRRELASDIARPTRVGPEQALHALAPHEAFDHHGPRRAVAFAPPRTRLAFAQEALWIAAAVSGPRRDVDRRPARRLDLDHVERDRAHEERRVELLRIVEWAEAHGHAVGRSGQRSELRILVASRLGGPLVDRDHLHEGSLRQQAAQGCGRRCLQAIGHPLVGDEHDPAGALDPLEPRGRIGEGKIEVRAVARREAAQLAIHAHGRL